ncbi:disulfide bond formation protein B [Patescibacteria group bacterium]|nr:MAG: disulfide bond formation protein B [Patescibacteria group bacterium]
MELLETLNFLIALGAVGMQILSVALIVVFFNRERAWAKPIAKIVSSKGLWISLLVTTLGTILSLVYSEYLGILPCGLCWLQRVFLYPQVVLFALASLKKDHYIADYAIVLSFLGGIVALYQHYLQMGGTDVIPCPATGAGDCAKRFLFEFDYMTFPLVAFSSFALIFIIMLFVREQSKT